jgi:hypothetical protein
MLELKTKANLAKESHLLARSMNLVRHRGITYRPADFETRETANPLPPERTIWIPVKRDDLRILAAEQFETLFASDGELSGFDFMVQQHAQQSRSQATGLLVRTVGGLAFLGSSGTLSEPSGEFVPNTLSPVLNEDPEDQAKMFAVLAEWVASEEEAHSLLRHLATSLAPDWSAVKYVLFLGEGRNGKSLLLKMLEALFGTDNVSNITRQDIAEKSPVVTELNGKLLNIVYDGRAEYLKDSGTEKSLIAGEPAAIRKLYESGTTMVQTNALFLEGLNREPKSNDKSSALQKRLVRFQFPNIYDLNIGFERYMLSEKMLGAFLALLIEHYVKQDEVATMLAPTAKSLELQLEHMFSNSQGLQYLRYVDETDPLGIAGLLGTTLDEAVAGFQSWRVKENDLGTWSAPDVAQLLMPLINTELRSKRVNGQPRKVKVITSLKTEADAYMHTLRSEEESDDLEALVGE